MVTKFGLRRVENALRNDWWHMNLHNGRWIVGRWIVDSASLGVFKTLEPPVSSTTLIREDGAGFHFFSGGISHRARDPRKTRAFAFAWFNKEQTNDAIGYKCLSSDDRRQPF